MLFLDRLSGLAPSHQAPRSEALCPLRCGRSLWCLLIIPCHSHLVNTFFHYFLIFFRKTCILGFSTFDIQYIVDMRNILYDEKSCFPGMTAEKNLIFGIFFRKKFFGLVLFYPIYLCNATVTWLLPCPTVLFLYRDASYYIIYKSAPRAARLRKPHLLYI